MDGEPQALTAATLEQGIERHGSAMGRRFGWLFHLAGLGLLLRGLRFEEHSAERIRRASEKGPVVYALYHRSQLDLLALNKALNARRLPLASFVNGMRTIWWLPVPTFWRSVRSRLRTFGQPYLPIESGWLTDLLMAGGHAALFMLGARRIIDRLLRRPEPDVSEALLRAQRRCWPGAAALSRPAPMWSARCWAPRTSRVVSRACGQPSPGAAPSSYRRVNHSTCSASASSTPTNPRLARPASCALRCAAICTENSPSSAGLAPAPIAGCGALSSPPVPCAKRSTTKSEPPAGPATA